MYRRVLRSVVLTSLAVLVAIPALPQIRADLGPLHIRIANTRPPRARYERRPPRPHRDSVWIGGYWDLRDDNWAWLSGRWEQPRERNVRWISPRYAREGCPWYRQRDCSWRYEPGHWSNQQVMEGDDYRQWKESRRSHRDRRHH
jgi:WXXGXW repeat (2 copies)